MGVFLIIPSLVSFGQMRVEIMPNAQFFNYAYYPLSNVGADVYVHLGKHWTVNYHASVGMPNNNALYFHVGVPQAVSGFCFHQWLDGGSAIWGGVGLLVGWLPEGLGYQWQHRKFTGHFNVSLWGWEGYSQRYPKEKWSFPSQTLQYRVVIPKQWRSIDSISPYIAVTLNDNSWEMNMPALGWRLGIGVTLKKKDKAPQHDDQRPSPPKEEEFN